MKKLIALLLALSMVLCLTACGEKTPSESDTETKAPADNVQNEDPAVEQTEEVPAVSGGITLEALMAAPTSPEEDFFVVDCGDGIYELIEYMGDDEIVVIPDTVGGKTVTRIGAYVFGSNSDVKAVRIPDSVTEVGKGSFGLNLNLEIVVFGSGVITVGESAFQGCANVHTIILNEGLTTLNGLAFSDCDSLGTLEIPDSVTDIKPMVFYGSESLITIVASTGSAAEAYANEAGIAFQAK